MKDTGGCYDWKMLMNNINPSSLIICKNGISIIKYQQYNFVKPFLLPLIWIFILKNKVPVRILS